MVYIILAYIANTRLLASKHHFLILLIFHHNFAVLQYKYGVTFLIGKFNGLLHLLPGYTKNFYKKDDEILVFHSHEHPSMPAAPYPCKIF